jgi:hypothetical protein
MNESVCRVAPELAAMIEAAFSPSLGVFPYRKQLRKATTSCALVAHLDTAPARRNCSGASRILCMEKRRPGFAQSGRLQFIMPAYFTRIPPTKRFRRYRIKLQQPDSIEDMYRGTSGVSLTSGAESLTGSKPALRTSKATSFTALRMPRRQDLA